MTKKRKLLSFISVVLGLMLTVTPSARAVELVISENGAGSESEVQISQETQTNVTQTNEANIANDVNVSANTGENEASGNTGGNVAVSTGDVNENLVVENSVNSSVVETDCCPQDIKATISGNGVDSENEIRLENENETAITVNQIAYITNNIQGNANTGENTANDNTGGSVAIDTGNIYVSGGIQNGPINSTSVKGGSGGAGVSAKISGNGAGSTNSIFANFENDADIFLNFNSDIDNFVNWDLNTGRNEASGNSGNVSILTGDIFFDFLIKNGPINVGGVDWGCCDVFDPGEPGDGGPPPGDGDGGVEEPGEEENGEEPTGEEEEDELLTAAAAGLSILGLSATGGLNFPVSIWAGLFMLFMGGMIILEETKGLWGKRLKLLKNLK